MAKLGSFPPSSVDRRAALPASDREPARLQINLTPLLPGRPSAVILGAIGGFFAGVLLWGYVVFTLVAAIDSLLGETNSHEAVADAAEADVLDCASFGAVRALSPEDEARFQTQCGATAPPLVQPTVAPTVAPPASTATNRANCNEIRGKPYRSPEERTWFLANCITR